ncbi:MAG TPA: protease modulator HflC, partial [Acidobacteria bacterium]|nr:protease modulator HflC [Acidobacteriota bacterium]
MTRNQPLAIVLGLIVLFLLGGSVYTVSEVDQAIITQFGEPVGEPVIEPGLHFKIPFIQTANMFERRFLEWDGFRNQVPTRDRRFIWVDTYARWRITDPLLFFQRLRDERGAQSRLDDILDGETRNAVARHDLIEIVRTSNREPLDTATTGLEEAEVLEPISIGREQITQEILEAATEAVAELGIELLDLQFKRINYVAEVQQDVFARMIAERQRIA